MISFLLDSIANLGLWIVWALETFVNYLLSGVGALVQAVLAALPPMSDAPALGSLEPWVGWLNYLLPIGTMLDSFAAALTLYVAVLAVRWALNYTRAL